jgi:predicted deacylase
MSVEMVTPEVFKAKTFAPGSKERYLVYVGEFASGTPVGIPVAVVAGTRPGPTVLICAGVHGEEPAAMDAVARVARQLTPDRVKGTLLAVPLVNPPAWIFRTRHFPLDAPNMGDVGGLEPEAGGIMSARVLAAVVDGIASRVQFAMDVHATHLDSINYPRTMVTISGAEADDVQRKRLELGRAAGYEIIHLWKRAGRGGVTGTLNRRGVPAIAIEAGEGWRTLEPFPSILVRGLVNFLKATGTVDGEPELPSMQVEVTTRHEITANRGGMSHLRVKPGDYVERGQVVAEIRDMFGDVVEELRSPTHGIIIRCSLLPTVATGARVCNVYETGQTAWRQRKVPALEQQIRVTGLPA